MKWFAPQPCRDWNEDRVRQFARDVERWVILEFYPLQAAGEFSCSGIG